MMDDRWHETKRGTVVRRYFHAAGASREMRVAQERGWRVQEVLLNGDALVEDAQTKWWRRPSIRLARGPQGSLELRARGWAGRAGDWHLPPERRIRECNLEVTYVRD